MKNTSILTTIGADDYPYLRNITGFKKYSNVSYKGIADNSSTTLGYTVTRNDKQVELYATYGKDGNLINGIYIVKNYHMPKVILDYLVTDSYKGWVMTSNKTIVHDFNTQKTEYVVKIQRDKMKQTLFFDRSGNRINKLTRT